MGNFQLLAVFLLASSPFSNAPLPAKKYDAKYVSQVDYERMRGGAWTYCTNKPVVLEDPVYCMKLQDDLLSKVDRYLGVIDKWFDYEAEPVDTASCNTNYLNAGGQDLAPLELCLRVKADAVAAAHAVPAAPANAPRQSSTGFYPKAFCKDVAGGSYYVYKLCMEQEMTAKSQLDF